MLKLDTDILLWINGHHSEWADVLMWYISDAKTWLPLYALLLGLIVYRFRNWRTLLFIFLGFALAVGLSDFTSSSIIKPLVCRLRPTHEPSIDPVRLIHDYTGGRYGFCSSHAADTMACGLLFSLLYRNKIATAVLMVWVALNCYSRMYLGVHYPSDIAAGLLIGALFAWAVYRLLSRRISAPSASAPQNPPRAASGVAPQDGS